MINKLNLENILFLDIETVPEYMDFAELDDNLKELWEAKSKYQRKDDYSAEAFYDRAGIWAEFGKIICISAGYFVIKGSVRNFRVTTFHGDEVKLLKEFKSLLETHFNKPMHLLCAHNGKEFDFPYIARRMIIQNISLPGKLNLFGKKPWEIPPFRYHGVMEIWRL
jgi:DNA polymerase elongation subunit (family B)